MTIVLAARAIHVMAGVIWAGTTFVMTVVILPMMARHGAEGFGRWTGIIARRVGPISGISALLTVLSGIYLFAALHPHDASTGGLVLKIGAVTALLSLITGFLVGRPAGIKLAELSQSAGSSAPPDLVERIAALGRRATLSARLVAILLGVSVLSMALFRYIGAL
ncbi:MAG: hypothetical protein E6K53_16665 [Gammaproteobacteria bacterium]|nr:MAG: hypothetical protein E6K53_16665 [Gammaproteobacteria bacterium]